MGIPNIGHALSVWEWSNKPMIEGCYPIEELHRAARGLFCHWSNEDDIRQHIRGCRRCRTIYCEASKD